MYEDAFDNYSSNSVKAISTPPGKGGGSTSPHRLVSPPTRIVRPESSPVGMLEQSRCSSRSWEAAHHQLIPENRSSSAMLTIADPGHRREDVINAQCVVE